MNPDERLKALGITLPVPAKPRGAYKTRVRAGGLLFVAGQLPLVDGVMKHPGRVGAEVTLEQGQAAARIAAINVLAHLREELGGFDALAEIARVDGFVAAVNGFIQIPQVLDGASNLFAEVLGERAGHTRTAIGMAYGPNDACVELGVIAVLRG